jgi:UDP-glucose 4-epimerase
MQRFLVTGGAGFIGSHLADALLAAGAAVRVLDDFSTGRRENLDPRCEVCVGDVADPEAVRTAFAGVDGCFHLAAIASVARGNEDWRGTHRTNQTGTVTVLEAARDAGRKPVVYASSAAVYGDLAGAVARETSPCVPLTAYGADKLGSELHARVAHRVHGVPTLGLRFFNVYGPRQDPASPYSGVVSIFAARLARGETLSVHGDGLQTRDFVFVADVVAHLRAAMAWLAAPKGADQGGAEVFNVCTGRATSVLNLAEVLGELLGRRPHIVPGPGRAGDIRNSLGDPAAARAALGVAAETAIAAGLGATLGFLQEHENL